VIRFSQLVLARGTKRLIDGADLALNPGEHIGLIGANGAGKSSLFALLRDEIHADKGDVEIPRTWRVAHVAQETPALDRPALDYAIDGDVVLRQLEADLVEAEAADDGARMADIHVAMQDADAYTVRARAEKLLVGLGFAQSQLNDPVASFSGGWRMRLNLAQALMCPSDLLLLDEPTNHLDLDAILWVEEWLKRYRGTLVVISHDRDFLDGVVNVIVHIDQEKLVRYGGNYSDFERQRAARLVLAAAQVEKQQRERAHLQSFIDRFKAKATKARQAQSRMKMLAKMEELAPLHAAAPFSFEFREPLRAPDPLLLLEDVEAGYAVDGEAKAVLKNVTFSLRTGERYGLLGVNGAGKSTLMKTLAGELSPLSGTATLGKGLAIGYFAQHQVEMLRDDQSPLWHLKQLAPDKRELDLRSFLGQFNFPGDMATGPIESFSGGEKARLALALIVWQRPNLLLLDEPTNHLDLETREALTVALAQFEGTLVLVSHDRHLLRATTEQFMIVADGTLKPFDGDLDDYRDWLLTAKLPGEEKSKGKSKPEFTAAPAVERKPEPSRRNDNKSGGARGSLSARKPIEQRIERIEREMAKRQSKKAEVDARLAEPSIYDAANKDALQGALSDQAYLAKELADLENEWLAKQAELEALG